MGKQIDGCLKLKNSLLYVLALGASLPSFAAALTVTNTNDSGPGSLRTAIETANPGDTIEFNLPNPSTIALTTGSLVINKSLSIKGPATTQVAIDGNRQFTVLSVNAGNVTLSGLTIQNGNGLGGGILNFSTLTVLNSTVSGNISSFAGGGILDFGDALTVINSTLSGNSAMFGGGIFSDASSLTGREHHDHRQLRAVSAAAGSPARLAQSR